VPLNTLARIACDAGDWPAARRHYEEALALKWGAGDRRGAAHVLSELGALALQQGDVRRAGAHFREGLALFRAVGDPPGAASCLFGLARVAAASGQAARAARILGAAVPHLAPFATNLHLPVAAVRSALGEASFAAAWAEGQALSLEAAVADALAPDELAPTPAGADEPAACRQLSQRTLPAPVLTRREREVAALVARGLSNRQIAAELSITERTAENHVEHILTKLGFRSRAQVAAWVVERALAPAGAA
jgi:non-specific serine/threonine protein kinase